MGLFSSKKKYHVNVTVQPIFEENQIPKSPAIGLIKGIMDDGDVVDYMLEEVSGSIGVRANNGFNWLKQQDYPIGFPTGQTATYISAKTSVITTIEANIGQDITPVYYYMGPLNSMHFGWSYCHDALGYNASTNELALLTAQNGFPCYLSDMKATYLREDYDFMLETGDTGMLDQLGPSPQSGYTPSKPMNVLGLMGQYAAQPAFEVSDVATDDYVTINYEFKDAAGIIQLRGLTVSMASFDNTADFHMCRYTKPNGSTGFFTYQHNSGTYPAIDAAYTLAFNQLGTYMPWAYFRSMGQRVKNLESEATVQKIRQWCNYLGVSFDQLYDGVHEDPDSSDVEQALLMFAIQPGTQNIHELEYLFKHFSALHENSLSQHELAGTLVQKMDNFTSSPSQVQRIQDNRFKMDFQYTGITRARKAGKIGSKGTYTGVYGTVAQRPLSFITQGQEVGEQQDTPLQSTFTYRYQVLDSIYEEIVVYNLRVVYGVHSKKGFAAGKNHAELLVPVDHAIALTMGVPAREQMLCRALKMMVNTVIVTKSHWYTSDWFKVILIAIAIVITILSLGQAWPALVAAASLGAVALTMAILTIIVKALIIRYTVKLFIKAVGPEWGIVVAIAAMIYGSYRGMAAPDGSSTWSEELIAVGNNLTTESQHAYGEMLEDMQDEFLALQEYSAGKFESLKEKRDQLGLNPQFAGLDGLDLVKLAPGIVIGESPSNYYARTVHSGNIGVKSFDMTENFVALNLMLPTLNKVEGDFYDGGIPTD